MAEHALDHAMEKTHADQRNRRRAGRAHRPDSRARHPAHVQSQRVSATPRPRCCRTTPSAMSTSPARSSSWSPTRRRLTQNVAKPDDMIDCQGGTDHARRPRHSRRQERPRIGVDHRCTRRWSDPATWPPSSSRSRWARTSFYQYIRDFGFGSRTGVELPGETRGLLRPAKQVERLTPSAPSPSARRSASRRCNWFPWFRPSPMAASICRRTC